MRPLRLGIAACAAVLLAPSAHAKKSALAGPYTAEVVSVVDGDTVAVRVEIWPHQFLETKVRLAGVNAPELRAKCAAEADLAERARAFVADALGPGDLVQLSDIEVDKYGNRYVARLALPGGKDLSEALVSAGLAAPASNGRLPRPWCAG